MTTSFYLHILYFYFDIFMNSRLLLIHIYTNCHLLAPQWQLTKLAQREN